LNSVANSSGTRKRKHNDSDTEDDTPHVTDSEGVDKLVDNDEGDADRDEEEYQSPKVKATSVSRKGKAKSSPKKKTGPSTKKPRTEKATMPKTLKASTRRGRKLKEGEDTYDPEQVAKDTKISADNPLFSE
jgi:cohesin complex subunit SA-1/2